MFRVLVASLGMMTAATVLAGCSTGTTSSTAETDSASCSELLELARSHLDAGVTYEELATSTDSELLWAVEELSRNCPGQLARLRSEVRALAGSSRPGEPPGDAAEQSASGSISWDRAIDFVGETKTVCGPLVNDGQSDDDVFLNLGRGYPDPDRFTIVIWDVGGVEEIATGTTVCADGKISLYEGVAQIQADLDAVQVDLP